MELQFIGLVALPVLLDQLDQVAALVILDQPVRQEKPVIQVLLDQLDQEEAQAVLDQPVQPDQEEVQEVLDQPDRQEKQATLDRPDPQVLAEVLVILDQQDQLAQEGVPVPVVLVGVRVQHVQVLLQVIQNLILVLQMH